MIQVEKEEGKKLAEKNVCGECGSPLTLAWGGSVGIDGWVVRCGMDPEHIGLMEKESYTEAVRRGALVPIYIEDKVRGRMLPEKADLDRIIALVSTRFPRADLDHPSAATFILDCWRLDLDPLLGEIVPVTFKSKRKGEDGKEIVKKVVTPVITEDGWLSMASRGCPERWAGAPRAMRLEDYLATQPEHKGKSPEKIKALTREIKADTCKDEDAFFWVAIGKIKLDNQVVETEPAYGWLKKKEWEKAQEHETPAGELPGNQARVRAIKRWVRENFPESKHRMMDMTAEWLGRAEGVREAEEIIDAEYRLLAEGEAKALPKAKAKAEKPAQPGKPEPEHREDPPRESLLTIDQLYRVCHERWGMQPADVNKELGVANRADITETPWESYLRIKAVRQ